MNWSVNEVLISAGLGNMHREDVEIDQWKEIHGTVSVICNCNQAVYGFVRNCDLLTYHKSI